MNTIKGIGRQCTPSISLIVEGKMFVSLTPYSKKT